ncbi:hypothetical protein ICV35_23770 [Rhodococcus ruber]|uniref:DUF6221 family protein n=1 Tax=Rhodococcus ruber TaxID=1830 RepID=UPI0017854960|nr:DUF6221 family protein [Rhodococcus ruber]MBD8056672.1 hypothetical protein [Rhodococcus ruber]
MNIVDFITARLNDDADEAHKAEDARDDELWVVTGSDNAVGVDYFPARILREVEAKREILAEHGDNEGQCARCLDDDGVWVEDGRTIAYTQPWPCRTIRALASVYVDHLDFVAEWRI